ncbi:MYND-type zinc finger protein samB [Psilocybe cubensis]|uniref:MYND-type zinc finger protein samB n=2 Tax=Psilocybe cubensis TaxID=181762 RepID=A0ACB8H2R0_PSICU|nr:MYND-type zinc finger protein samB [Psilocybe cubensis]KAH9481932.1 MYND-type zinc finger protein samB [Psilocybe cubensis]
MRESNFAFPAQNKACVCITSQLYDRRALDTTSPLPLFNSLTHLTYLTSTSPRIREIMTMDGGLERLVRILHEFCICPPPPENPAILYGLTPPNARLAKLSPALNPHSFDKHAAYRFSLAFQCIVNIGVRGSEPIRSRVVQAGTLEVVGCILEAWLANKGFAVGPSSSATGIPRETREQRQQRRIAQMEHRQREDAAHLQRALQRQLMVEQMQHRTANETQRQRVRQGRPSDEQDDLMDYSPAEGSMSHILLLSESHSQPSNSNSDTDVSTDNSMAATPQGSGTPTGSVVIPSRDRSGTIIARPIWDNQTAGPATAPTATATTAPPATAMALAASTTVRGRRTRHRELPPESPSASTDISRAETETEDDIDVDNDVDMDIDRHRIDSDVASASASPSPERRPRGVVVPVPRHNMGRRAVGIVSDEPNAGPQTLQVGGLGLDTDAHIIINEAGGVVGDGGVGVGVEVGVEDGIVSLEPNDDFAMGAPPGAPGAIIGAEGATPRVLNLNAMDGGAGGNAGERRRRGNTVDAPDVTPRAALVGLPMMAGAATIPAGTTRATQGGAHAHAHHRTATIRGRPAPTAAEATAGTGTTTAATGAGTGAGTTATVPTAAQTAAANLAAALGGVGLGGGVGGGQRAGSSSHHHRDADSGPYRDEDVLLSLQLLAYLSKYPHVRQAFYKPRVTFHPASVNLPGARFGVGVPAGSGASTRERRERERVVAGAPSSSSASVTTAGASSSTSTSPTASTSQNGFFRAFTNAASSNSRGKTSSSTPSTSTPSSSTSAAAMASSSSASNVNSQQTPVVSSTAASTGAPSSAKQTNVFSLVERFTFKPSSTETDLPNPPPRLPPEIQYWAGVIMRNACRKDDSRGGIRQCANMMCGKWETYPREFAKCRRCRKAKYCGKECQSTAWSEGHRFWCSAKDVDEDNLGEHAHAHGSSATSTTVAPTASQSVGVGVGNDAAGGTVRIAIEHGTEGNGNVPIINGNTPRVERRQRERERERERIHGTGGDGDGTTTTAAVTRGYRPGGVSASTSPSAPYVTPTTSTTTAAMGVAGPSRVAATTSQQTVGMSVSPRAEASGMARDRTVQPNAPHVRPRPVPTMRPPLTQAQLQQQAQDPTNTSYLTFHIQGAGPSNHQHHVQAQPQDQNVRRRAETITGATASSHHQQHRTAVEVAPNVVIPPPRSYVHASVSPTTTDWPMGGSSPAPPDVSMRADAGPSRRHRLVNIASPRSPTDDGQDDMVIG